MLHTLDINNQPHIVQFLITGKLSLSINDRFTKLIIKENPNL